MDFSFVTKATILLMLTTTALAAESTISSGSWRNCLRNVSDCCKWPQIKCNSDGRVVEISVEGDGREKGASFDEMNLLDFPALTGIHLSGIGLVGTIPRQIGTLSQLSYLNLSGNYLTGELPVSVANLTKLIALDISFNSISGSIPPGIGNLTSLITLRLSSNAINGSIPSTIGKLKRLKSLLLNYNSISGSIPEEIGNLTGLVDLNLGFNKITSSIPTTLIQLTRLKALRLPGNEITGPIPQNMQNLQNLIDLDLGINRLTGRIPVSLYRLIRLRCLSIASNRISDRVEFGIARLKRLSYLVLSRNQIYGAIPQELMHLIHLKFLDLSSNRFSGEVPSGVGALLNLTFLDMSNNTLRGGIPVQTARICSMRMMDISRNAISGEIPSDLGDCPNSNSLIVNLSHNSLSGLVPQSLYNLLSVDLSYNVLEGQIPRRVWDKFPKTSFVGNLGLLNYSQEFYPTPEHRVREVDKNYTKIYVPVVLLALFLALSAFGGWPLVSRLRAKETSLESLDSKHGDIFRIWNYDGKIAYEDIIEATGDFDIRHCIGAGGYGSVYRAEFPNGRVVALKKLHTLEGENPALDKCFRKEAQILSGIRHKNIVKLFGFCLHKRCMFLIYDYMERGSLFYLLSDDAEAVELDWSKRVNVVKDIAHALSYMHHDCSPPILHRDISSNNILLNSKLEARLSDFGNSRLLDPDSSNLTLVAGTPGYMAPGIVHFNGFHDHQPLLVLLKPRFCRACLQHGCLGEERCLQFWHRGTGNSVRKSSKGVSFIHERTICSELDAPRFSRREATASRGAGGDPRRGSCCDYSVGMLEPEPKTTTIYERGISRIYASEKAIRVVPARRIDAASSELCGSFMG